jgi:UDP-N-acetylmuramate: L-alanyl-gamma-D-glutamyl-meso-diaminopimelate ligase
VAFLQDFDRPLDALYFLPVGGTAMAPLAGLLAELGHHVRGVDATLYPPMSTLLAELGIPVRLGYDPERIPADLDRVVIGNAVARGNPEVAAVLERGLPHLSQAEAVAHYVLGRGLESLVVAGTHGKTTTSAMLAWTLEQTGADPSSLIGGLPRWNPRGFRLGGGRLLVIEGDEYNAAFFDRGPKFLHYRPHVFVIGPVEFDHADLYPDLEAVLTAFRAGAALVPRDGAVVLSAWSGGALAAGRGATAPVLTVGEAAGCDLRVTIAPASPEGGAAELRWRGQRQRLTIPLPGTHNLQNAALAVAAAVAAGADFAAAVAALASFPGVARRMEVVGERAGVTVVDDFAHHPTALAVTIAAARERWPGRRLVVAFEPRSLTAARRDFQDAYLEALGAADLVLVAAPFHADRLAPEAVLDRRSLAAELAARGVPSLMPEAGVDAAAALAGALVRRDVVLGCSSGDFQGFHRRLLAGLIKEGRE